MVKCHRIADSIGLKIGGEFTAILSTETLHPNSRTVTPKDIPRLPGIYPEDTSESTVVSLFYLEKCGHILHSAPRYIYAFLYIRCFQLVKIIKIILQKNAIKLSFTVIYHLAQFKGF